MCAVQVILFLTCCRERGVSISNSPSPTEELQDDDMPANKELAQILKTLKRVEQNVKGVYFYGCIK